MTANGYKLRNPQTIAWIILLTGFFLFCVICVATTATARWFLFDSEVDLNVRLTVSRGRVDVLLADGVTSTGITSQQVIGPGTTLTTDSASQGYLTLEDNYTKRILATVFLMQESSITLSVSARPRFDWSINPYNVLLNSAAGRLVVEMPPGTGRILQLSVQSDAGEALFFAEGTFRLNADSQKFVVHADSGQAVLRMRSGENKLVARGMVGALTTGASDQPGKQTAEIVGSSSEVRNVGFGTADDIATSKVPPIGWACASYANQVEEPIGTFERVLYDQQVAMKIRRIGERLDHAETRCQFKLTPAPEIIPGATPPPTVILNPGNAQDIRGYSSLSIRAKIKIIQQDVTTCGVAGSECPVMLQLEYIGGGQTQYWRHGFFTLRPVNDNNPLACDTCVQEHEKLNSDTWYIYESGNLLKSLVGNKTPEYISQIDFYASGHSYDVIVANVSVIVGK